MIESMLMNLCVSVNAVIGSKQFVSTSGSQQLQRAVSELYNELLPTEPFLTASQNEQLTTFL